MARQISETERKQILQDVLSTLAEAIETAGPQGIPSGHLYSMLMDKLTLETYVGLIGILEAQGKITNVAHLLVATSGEVH